jgi:hypothetical protein
MKSAKSKSTPSKPPGKSEEKRLDNEKLDEIYDRDDQNCHGETRYPR